MDPLLQQSSHIHYVDDSLEIDEELKLEAYHDRSVFLPVQTYGMTEEHNGVRTADRFLHEQYLIVKEGNQKVLLSGCSHRGIYNIIQWAADEQVQTVIGGFPFMKLEPENFGQMDSTEEYPILYLPLYQAFPAPVLEREDGRPTLLSGSRTYDYDFIM